VVADPQRCVLVSGPARSGKSAWAETLAAASGRAVHYLATGPHRPDDEAWQERLRRHRERRPASWGCQEVGLQLAPALSACPAGHLALVDSLGTWVAAGLHLDQPAWQTASDQLLEALQTTPARVVLVAEETGWGVVPATAVRGLFRDRQGLLLQAVMRLCDGAWLVLHGRAINLLEFSVPVPSAGAW